MACWAIARYRIQFYMHHRFVKCDECMCAGHVVAAGPHTYVGMLYWKSAVCSTCGSCCTSVDGAFAIVVSFRPVLDCRSQAAAA